MSAEISHQVTPEVIEIIAALAALIPIAEYFRNPSSLRADDYYATEQLFGSLPVDVRAPLPYGPPVASFPLPKGHATELPNSRPIFHRKA